MGKTGDGRTLKEGSRARILEMCREQLSRKNPPDTKALYGRAALIDPAVRDLSLRQFHAMFPLQVKRGSGPGVGEGVDEGISNASPNLREVIREALWRFAREVVEVGEGVDEIFSTLQRVDTYVDHILKANPE